jgi:hypothetical protein
LCVWPAVCSLGRTRGRSMAPEGFPVTALIIGEDLGVRAILAAALGLGGTIKVARNVAEGVRARNRVSG